jgi:hypothetical protein
MTTRSQTVYEPFAVQPSYVDTISAIIPLGAVTHLLFAAHQPSAAGECVEHILQTRVIVPTDQLKVIGRAILAGRLEAVPATDAEGNPIAVHSLAPKIFEPHPRGRSKCHRDRSRCYARRRNFA